MKTFRRSIVIFFLFFLGTICLAHIDRQCAQMFDMESPAIEKLEKCIENQTNLL